MAAVIIHLGGEKAEYFSLTVHDRVSPHAVDYWNANWLCCTAEACALTFRGWTDGYLFIDEIRAFYHEVAELYQRLTGQAVLETMEHWLRVQLRGDGLGHIHVEGKLQCGSCYENVLEFHLSLDQTYLPPFMAQLRAALEAFPVIGSR